MPRVFGLFTHPILVVAVLFDRFLVVFDKLDNFVFGHLRAASDGFSLSYREIRTRTRELKLLNGWEL